MYIAALTRSSLTRPASFVRGKSAEELYEKMQTWMQQFDVAQFPKSAKFGYMITLSVPVEDLHWLFSKSRGPGGQNVNKGSKKMSDYY